MAPRDTKGCTFRPSFRVVRGGSGKTSYSYSMLRKFNCSSFSFRVQGWRGASAGSCFGLIEIKPPKHVGCLGTWPLMQPHGQGAGPEPGSLHIHFYKQLAPESAVNGMEWCSCTKSFPEKKHFHCKHISAFLRGFVGLCEWIKEAGQRGVFLTGDFSSENISNSDLHRKRGAVQTHLRESWLQIWCFLVTRQRYRYLYIQIGSDWTTVLGPGVFFSLQKVSWKFLPQNFPHAHTGSGQSMVFLPKDRLKVFFACCTLLW